MAAVTDGAANPLTSNLGRVDLGESFNRDRPLSFHWKLLDSSWLDGLSLPVARSDKQSEARASILTEAVIVGRAEPDRWISYSRRAAFYTGQDRYHGTAYTFATVPSVIDQLATQGLLDHDKKPPGNIGWQSRFRASPTLMATLERPLSVMFDPLEVVRLKDRDGRLVDYRDTAATERMRGHLLEINEALKRVRIDLDMHSSVQEGDVIRCGELVLYRDHKALWRVFNRSRFSLGGRFYGPWWQTARKADRQHIALQGEPTVEHDYEQLHPRLIYALAGKRLDGDAYTLNGWDRSLTKRAFNILLNAETYEASQRALANHIGGKGALGNAARLIETVKARHTPIAQYFHTGVGLKLQRKDSDVAEQVMLDLLDDGIVALPIHDSFVVQARYADHLRTVMDRALFKAFPSLRTKGYQAIVPHMAGGGMVCLVMPFPAQGDLFPSMVSVPVADLSWRRGILPHSVRIAVRHELGRRAMRQDDLARHIGVSQPQLANALRGRFGLGTAAAERLKAFVIESAWDATN